MLVKQFTRKIAEKLNCEFHRTFQKEPSNYTLWPGGNNNSLTQISSDKHYHFLGCLSSPMELRFLALKKDEIRYSNRLFDDKSGIPSNKYNVNSTGSTESTRSTESKIASINRKYNVFKRYIEEKGNGGKIYDESINPLRSTNEYTGSKLEGTEYANVTMGVKCEECSNKRRIGEMQACFGQLFRVGTLAGNVQKSTTSQKTCTFVHAHSYFIQKESRNECHISMSPVQICDGNDVSPSCCDNDFIIVDTFEDKSRIAKSITLKILDGDPNELIYYITCIAEFGFDHIIIIGETYGRLIFLDCYGRVFLWDDENLLLCPLGNFPEEASKYSFNKDRLGWFVKNGIVYEYILKFG